MAGEKRSNVEIEMVVNQICKMMIRGITRTADILDYIKQMDALPEEEQKKKNWVPVNKEMAMIKEYIRRAKEMLIESAKEDRESIRSRYVEQLEYLYQLAVNQGKLHTANQIMKTKIYLQGMGGMNVTGNFNINKFDIQLSPEEEADYKKRLEDMYGEE